MRHEGGVTVAATHTHTHTHTHTRTHTHTAEARLKPAWVQIPAHSLTNCDLGQII